jgi:hypothetical protein
VVKLTFKSASFLPSLADYRNLVLHPRESEKDYDPRREMRGSGIGRAYSVTGPRTSPAAPLS